MEVNRRLALSWIGILAVFFGCRLDLTLGAAEPDTLVNVLFIYQEAEGRALFQDAVKYLKENPDRKVKVGKVHEFDASSYNDSVKLTSAFCKIYDDAMATNEMPDIAIDFTRIGIPSEGVKVALAALQMPTIAATFGQEGDVREWRHLTVAQQKYLIQVSPPADVLIQSVRSIVSKQNMTSAVVLFDDEQFEMHHKYKSLLQNMPTRHLLTKTASTREDLSAQLDRLVHVDIVNFFIAGKVEQITEVLTVASKPTLRNGPYFSDEFAWYSMSLIPGEQKLPQCSQCETDVTVVHLMPEEIKASSRKAYLGASRPNMSLTEMFYFDIALDAVMAIADLKKTGNYTISKDNTCKGYQKDKTRPYEPLTLDLLKSFTKAAGENGIPFHLEGRTGKNYPKFNMTMKRLVLESKKAAHRSADIIGKWTSGFADKDDLVIYDKGKDFLAQHLAHTVFRVVTYVQPPFVMKYRGCVLLNKYTNCFYGYCIDLLEKIKGELKFNYTIRDVPDGYGYMNEKYPHEWNGMVRELKDRKADIALGAMSVMAERESVVDFTVPYYDLVGISILMKKPKQETSLFKFLTVLENDVWLCILAAYFFTSLLMWVFDRFSPYSYQNNREKYEDDEEKREFNLKECLWFCMTSLTPQGGGEAPKNLSGRLVAATWWLFGFIIIASYTANLAAFLTVSRLDAPIESLEDLSKQYKVQYAPMKGSSACIYFDRMAHIEHRFYEIWKDMSLNDTMSDFDRSQLAVWDYPVSDKYTKMWQAMTENNPPLTFEAAVERVRALPDKNSTKEKDGFAFLGDATDIRYQVLTNCDLQMIGEEFSRKPYALAVQQGSPLKDQLNDAILKLLNQRYLEQLKETWWNDNREKAKCDKEDNQSDGISIHNIGGVFIVIFVGIVMACLTLIFEYWWYRKRNIAEDVADMALPPPKEFGTTFTTSTPPSIEKTNFNTQYDKPPERTTLPSIENSW